MLTQVERRLQPISLCQPKQENDYEDCAKPPCNAQGKSHESQEGCRQMDMPQEEVRERRRRKK